MNKFNKLLKTLLTAIFIILLLAYVFVSFCAHGHECVGTDCAICEVIEAYRNILARIALSTAIYQLAKMCFVILSTCIRTIPIRYESPVGLKVKLSD